MAFAWVRVGYTTVSIRSKATLDCSAVSSSTEIWFTTTPSFRPSSTHERYAGCMRYIVEHGQTTESRQKTVLSGFSAASLFIMLISVPTAMTLPRAASLPTFLPNAVAPLYALGSG